MVSTEASNSPKQTSFRPSPNRTRLQRLSQRPPRRHRPMQPLRLHRLWLRPRLREASPQPVSNSTAAPVPVFRPCLLITATLVTSQRRLQHRLVCSPCVRTGQEKGKGSCDAHPCWCYSCCILSASHDQCATDGACVFHCGHCSCSGAGPSTTGGRVCSEGRMGKEGQAAVDDLG